MDKKKKLLIVVLLLLCVGIATVPLLLIHDSEFGGADGAAEETIMAISPEYVRWAEGRLEPPAKRNPCCSACRPLWALRLSATASVIWWPAKTIAKRIRETCNETSAPTCAFA